MLYFILALDMCMIAERTKARQLEREVKTLKQKLDDLQTSLTQQTAATEETQRKRTRSPLCSSLCCICRSFTDPSHGQLLSSV